MVPFERIHNIMIDYANGIVLINGERVSFPFKVTVKEADGWDISKLFNPEAVKPGEAFSPPELIIDARAFQEMVTCLGLKELFRKALKEVIPPD